MLRRKCHKSHGCDATPAVPAPWPPVHRHGQKVASSSRAVPKIGPRRPNWDVAGRKGRRKRLRYREAVLGSKGKYRRQTKARRRHPAPRKPYPRLILHHVMGGRNPAQAAPFKQRLAAPYQQNLGLGIGNKPRLFACPPQVSRTVQVRAAECQCVCTFHIVPLHPASIHGSIPLSEKRYPPFGLMDYKHNFHPHVITVLPFGALILYMVLKSAE